MKQMLRQTKRESNWYEVNISKLTTRRKAVRVSPKLRGLSICDTSAVTLKQIEFKFKFDDHLPVC